MAEKIGTYRDCDMYYSDILEAHGGPPYYTPCIPGEYFWSIPDLKAAIDDKIGPTGEPYAVIDDFIVPDSLPAGSAVTVRILLRNTGALGYLDYYIDGNPVNPDRYTQVEAGRTPASVPSGATVWVDVPFRYWPMPAWDYKLTASNEDGTSSISRTIVLAIAGIPTTLDMMAPDRIAANELFDVYGNLIEKDTGTIISGQRINLSYDGKSLGYTYTGSEGDYRFTVSIPEGGVFTLKAEFPGTEGYIASESLTSTSVTVTPEVIAIQIGAPLLTGIVFRYIGTLVR